VTLKSASHAVTKKSSLQSTLPDFHTRKRMLHLGNDCLELLDTGSWFINSRHQWFNKWVNGASGIQESRNQQLQEFQSSW